MKKKRGRKPLDVIGDRYGRLVILKDVEDSKPRKVVARCDCGTKRDYLLAPLRNGQTKSCGCLRKEVASQAKHKKNGGRKATDLTGRKFGKLTAIKRVENFPQNAVARWLCHCECGEKKIMYASNLTEGATTSCGCSKGGGSTERWTKNQDKDIIRLKNSGMNNEEISKLVNRSLPALAKRFAGLRKLKGEKRCQAKDCQKNFIPLISSAKYCTEQCRWQESKRKKYEERVDKGLCKQCGGKKGNTDITYCKKCQDYFKKRWVDRNSDLPT